MCLNLFAAGGSCSEGRPSLLLTPSWPDSSLWLLHRRQPRLQTSTSVWLAPHTFCPSLSPTTAWPTNKTQRTWPPRSTKWPPPPWRRWISSRWAATRPDGRRLVTMRSKMEDTWWPTLAASALAAGRSAALRSNMATPTGCCFARTSVRRTIEDSAKPAERAAEREQTTSLFRKKAQTYGGPFSNTN